MNMNPNQSFQVYSDASCGTYQPQMAKLASMKPMFSSDPNALAMFSIPDDSYYKNIPSSSKPLRGSPKMSNSPLNFEFDIYGNEIEMNNSNVSGLYHQEEGSMRRFGGENGTKRGLRINKENMHPWTNDLIPMKSASEGSGLSRNPLKNVTPVVSVKKSGEISSISEGRIEVNKILLRREILIVLL